MIGRTVRGRGFSTLFLAFLFVASGSAVVALKLENEAVARARVPGSSIQYLPSGRYLKLASLGYSSVLADVIYVWAIQYYSDPAISDRFDHLDHIFSVIAELDPRYSEPYLIGALIAAYEAHHPGLALKILDRAMAKNPGDWIYPFEAGHYAQMFLKNYKIAQQYFKQAMDLKGAPDIAKRLYANAAFRTDDYDTAWKTWQEVYQTATDDRIRKIASNHLYEVKSAADMKQIDQAIAEFAERFRRRPMNLQQLVRAGLLKSVPQDLDGQDYVYDPRTGEVTTAIVPWKR
jgi:tetratricopeptide (TPR) repeat protein